MGEDLRQGTGEALARRRRFLSLGTAFAALVLFSQWFFHAGVLMRGDVLYHLDRIMGIAAGLAAGDLPVYVHGFQLQGYGTLDGALYPDFLLYFPAALVAAGMPLAAAWDAYWGFALCLSFFAAWRGYALLSGRWFLGLVCALLFAGSFYVLMFIGAGAGAYVATMFLPYAVGALSSVLRRADGVRCWPELVLACFMIAGAHVLTALTAALVLLVCLWLWRWGLRDGVRRQALLRAVLFSLALLLYRIVPFAYFYTHVDFLIRHPYQSLASLAVMTSGFPGLCAAELWWGWPLVFFFGAALFSRAFRRRRAFLATMTLAVLLTAMIWSGFPWRALERLPLVGAVLPLFQFSFRFLPLGLVPVVYFAARYLVAAAHRLARGRERSRVLALAFALLTIAYGMAAQEHTDFEMADFPITWRVAYQDIDPQFLAALRAMDYTYADIDPLALIASGDVPQPGSIRALSGDFSTASFRKTGARLLFRYGSKTGAEVEVPLIFYPGYEARVDGTVIEAREGAHHVLTLSLPAGAHTVFVCYSPPLAFRGSNCLSLLALALLCRAAWRLWRGRRTKPSRVCG